MTSSRIIVLRAVACAGVVASFCSAVAGDAPMFEFVGVSDRPGKVFDALNDGRLVAVDGDQILIELAAGAGEYALGGLLPAGSISEFGASFVSVSPDGSRLAIGDGRFGSAEVHLVEVADLSGGIVSPQSFVQENFDAAWMNNHQLAISHADPVSFLGRVTILDMLSGDRVSLIDIDGASSGVTFASDGSILVGNGFDTVGGATGEVRSFASSLIDDALAGRIGPIAFGSGALVTDLLSAASLRFDADGHLFVGGGDFIAGDAEYFAILDDEAVREAIAGGVAAGIDDAFTDDPNALDFSFYGAEYNAVTGEWIVSNFDDPFLYHYRLIPAPAGGVAMLALFVATRRRRPRDD
ncbi:MAG: hypothetical protein ACF8PN_15900 [Phycisphaerales bacterium]